MWWTFSRVDDVTLSWFRRRKDNQIMGLELLASSLGLCSFAGVLRGRRVIMHSDNTGSEVGRSSVRPSFACSCCFFSLPEVALRRGTARAWDHAQLVHQQWLHAAKEGLQLWVVRVATDDNIADLPSREVRHRDLLRARPCHSVLIGISVLRRHGRNIRGPSHARVFWGRCMLGCAPRALGLVACLIGRLVHAVSLFLVRSSALLCSG